MLGDISYDKATLQSEGKLSIHKYSQVFHVLILRIDLERNICPKAPCQLFTGLSYASEIELSFKKNKLHCT